MIGTWFFVIFVIYFTTICVITVYTSRKTNNTSFFLANKKSKWYIIAFGMIGTTLSGVTFISVPGLVGKEAFSYYPFVLGNAIGYVIIACVLMPLYYRLNITSIYSYVGMRFGSQSQKTAATFFLFARIIGSAARLYIVVATLQKFIFDQWHIPFFVTILICLAIIWAYTIKGGLQTIIWTDSIQTVFLIGSLICTIYFIVKSLPFSHVSIMDNLLKAPYTKMFFTDEFLFNKKHFIKQIIGGIIIVIPSVGLDQDLMQKNLSLPNINDAKKNFFVFTVIFVSINLLFLSVGALLKMYIDYNHISHITHTDYIFPTIALQYLGMGAGLLFMLGITAATFSTTDSALTALTTSFCIDILNFNKHEKPKKSSTHIRHLVHSAFCVIIFLICLLLYTYNNTAIVEIIFTIAGYTYAPLFGIYILGMYSKITLNEKLLPWVCVLAPIGGYLFNTYLKNHHIYNAGFEAIIINTFFCVMGIWLIRKKPLT